MAQKLFVGEFVWHKSEQINGTNNQQSKLLA